MKGRRVLAIVVLAGMAGAATGCIIGGRQRRAPRPGELDFKLGPFTYLEEGRLIGLAVGVEAARYREKEAYLPLAVCLANRDAPTLKLSRESFILQDESGRRYPLVPASDLRSGYAMVSLDRTFTTTFSMCVTHYPNFTRIESNFFPDPAFGGTVIDRLELPRVHATMDLLYFPMPDGGILGRRFELHVNAPGLPDEVFVKFLID